MYEVDIPSPKYQYVFMCHIFNQFLSFFLIDEFFRHRMFSILCDLSNERIKIVTSVWYWFILFQIESPHR
jgi:hypothetical protein